MRVIPEETEVLKWNLDVFVPPPFLLPSNVDLKSFGKSYLGGFRRQEQMTCLVAGACCFCVFSLFHLESTFEDWLATF